MAQNNSPRAGIQAGPAKGAARTSRLKRILAASAVVGAGIGAAYLLSEPGERYAWNMETFHSGDVLARKTKANGDEVRINRALWDGKPVLSLITVHQSAAAYPVPETPEINAMFGSVLGGKQPDAIYGHVPYRRAGDLIRYELPLHFKHLQASGTGYGRYSPEFAAAVNHVEGFIASDRNNQRVLDCFYATRDEKTEYHALYWYKERPTGLESADELRKISPNHPFLQIRYPRSDCPVRYEGALTDGGKVDWTFKMP
ncbi:MAG TPA: hypothetical protein PLF01_03490 [Alphaproteobacteria bacterium]|nr:hypothetical protein [Alphaproteobacteria bacterium]